MSTNLIGTSIGNYKITAKVGEGGMGSVYLGEHPLIGKKVAVKVLHDDLATKEDIVSRFFTEAKAVNDIQHPNIVDVVDFGKLRGPSGKEIVYFIMEYLDGEGLHSRLKREGVSIKDAINMVRQCASGLAASHAKSIVHRDIKPENIYLINRDGSRNYVKLLDFGIAKLTGGDTSEQHKTRTGLVIGTPSYMSPEQCEGKGNIDWRSDIYSLGIVLYEMLTGRPPFTGDGFGEILIAHMTKAPPPPSTFRSDIPAGLESVVMHALEKNRDVRFQTMEEFSAALADPDAHLAAHGDMLGDDTGPAEAIDDGAVEELELDEVQGDAIALEDGTGTNPELPAMPRASRSNPPRTGRSNPPRSTPIPFVDDSPGPRTMSEATVNQVPTTLSGASGEMAVPGYAPPRPAPQGGGKGIWIGLGGAVVACAAVVGYLVLRTPTHQNSELKVIQTVKPAEPISVLIESVPQGLKVFRGPENVGTTPFELKVDPSEQPFDVVVQTWDGAQRFERITPSEGPKKIVVQMAPVEEKPSPPPTKPVEPTKKPVSHREDGKSKEKDPERTKKDEPKADPNPFKAVLTDDRSKRDLVNPSFEAK